MNYNVYIFVIQNKAINACIAVLQFYVVTLQALVNEGHYTDEYEFDSSVSAKEDASLRMSLSIMLRV